MRRIDCCISCSQRCPACHDRCIEFGTQKMIFEWEKEKINKKSVVENQLRSFIRENIERRQRAHRALK